MSNHLPSLYQQYIHLSRYARFDYDKSRRETYEETVGRFLEFFDKHLKDNHNYTFPEKIRSKIEDSILNLEVMPSMRAMMTAGPALERDNISGYNCSYIPIDRTTSFDEVLYILMNGTGVGFSVERQYVNALPEVAEEFHTTDTTIVVADSKLGWAKALKELIHLLYGGQVPKWDLSRIRPAGSALKTFGGRASGPEPLEDLFNFCVRIFRGAAGRKLNSLECHDIVCKIADVVVVGGVRRSALISLSNLSDDRMRHAKSGEWWITEGQRRLSNNSAAYTEKPEIGAFMREWLALYDSKSGERGIINRASMKRQADNGRRDIDHEFGTNPCGEIILRPNQFCNLTEVVIRPSDDEESLRKKVEIATILGTFQSTLLNFRYINKRWFNNCSDERLLGVSLTGIMDNSLTYKLGDKLNKMLNKLKNITIETNRALAQELGINASTAITCVKPSGTVSQLVNSASGIHARHAEYYIRNVRGDTKDPLVQFMKNVGFPNEPDITAPEHVTIFPFPMKPPRGVVCRNDMSALNQLEVWLTYKKHWCEHNPSCTISVREDEWLDVGAWVYKNFDDIGGLSFLPMSDHIYRQAPYEDCNKEQYQELLKKMPKEVDWSNLKQFESTDNTTGQNELACTAGVCEI